MQGREERDVTEYKPTLYDIFLGTTCLPSQGGEKGKLLLRSNVTLDPRQKDRLQETGRVFVIT